ncbi:MAG: class I SAM-dependent methyltransferase [Gammaproteobacteria bacterium PRO9]|nr:class I SAM-dependent methyltransferase [Gammaproteobacteria bacterium PRO9]
MVAAPQATFNCRLCGAGGLAFHYALGRDGQCRYYKCPNCGLVNYDLSGGLEQEQYTRVLIDPADDRVQGNRDNDQSFRFLMRHVPVPGRLLDIGCGNGRLLLKARRAGWRVKGLELSATMAAFAAAEVGCEVRTDDFLEMDITPAERESFDVVSLRHVLEHLPDPLQAMARISALLRPGGWFLAEMPNIEGWSKRWVRFSERSGLHQRRFPADFAAGHACEYSRQSFDALLARTGFELVRWETYSKKPLANWLLSRWPIGTKARALARKQSGQGQVAPANGPATVRGP